MESLGQSQRMLALAPVTTIRSSFVPIESLIREARYVLGAIKRAYHLPCLLAEPGQRLDCSSEWKDTGSEILLERVPELETVPNSEVLATRL